MASAVKTFLVLLLILPLLIYIGSEIGSNEYLMPLVAGLLMFASLVFALFFRRQRVECLVLMTLLGGYIIGNRGFAQIYVVQPLFVGELAMVTILAVMIFRYATSREFVIAPHLLARLIALYLVYAFARLCFDWRTYGIDAVRDAALVYYAVFFFAAYQLGRREEAAAFVDRMFIWIFFLQGIVAAIFSFRPEWLDLLAFGGTSPLLQKADITATFCCVGILFITIRSDLVPSKLVRLVFPMLLAVCMVMTGVRSVVVALFGALVLTWIAARRGFITWPLVLGTIGIVGVLFFGVGSGGQFAATRDQLISIVDVSGTYHYQTDVGDTKNADNTFRRVLWNSIYKQTVQENEWVAGKGFGYNFIPTFEQEYQAGSWDTLRSAHNYFVTVFGRLGLLGLCLLIAIDFEIARHSLRAALALRRNERYDTQALTYWCAVWVILISGTFGVVLEGPMGAITFWSMLGLALASNDRFDLARKAATAGLTRDTLPTRWAQPTLARPAGAG